MINNLVPVVGDQNERLLDAGQEVLNKCGKLPGLDKNYSATPDALRHNPASLF
jgi:hypothetical protein